MPIEPQLSSRKMHNDDTLPAIKDVVAGLHWDPPPEGVKATADLDLLCVLFDAQGKVLEVVHSGRPRGVNDCIVHTGDSRTGASVWDDERIFVFTQALPASVAKFAFFVLSANGQPFDAIPGACCHVSDYASEEERVRTDLTALAGATEMTVAMLVRREDAWSLVTDMGVLHTGLLAELRRLSSSK